MELLERAELLAQLDELLAEAQAGTGRWPNYICHTFDSPW